MGTFPRRSILVCWIASLIYKRQNLGNLGNHVNLGNLGNPFGLHRVTFIERSSAVFGENVGSLQVKRNHVYSVR